MKAERLYQEYAALLEKIGPDMTVDELHESACSHTDNYEKHLLSYRFESYSMTKQIPFDTFCAEIAPPGCENEVLRHYCRLATGVPILPGGKDYTDAINAGGIVDKSRIPKLVVDVRSSGLSTTWKQRFVYLRKYSIEEIA